MSKIAFKINEQKCRGCRRCEAACSWTNSGMTNPRLAGIKIFKSEEEGKDYPVINQTCYQDFCGKKHPLERRNNIPLCVTTCLFGAITIEGEVI